VIKWKSYGQVCLFFNEISIGGINAMHSFQWKGFKNRQINVHEEQYSYEAKPIQACLLLKRMFSTFEIIVLMGIFENMGQKLVLSSWNIKKLTLGGGDCTFF